MIKFLVCSRMSENLRPDCGSHICIFEQIHCKPIGTTGQTIILIFLLEHDRISGCQPSFTATDYLVLMDISLFLTIKYNNAASVIIE